MMHLISCCDIYVKGIQNNKDDEFIWTKTRIVTTVNRLLTGPLINRTLLRFPNRELLYPSGRDKSSSFWPTTQIKNRNQEGTSPWSRFNVVDDWVFWSCRLQNHISFYSIDRRHQSFFLTGLSLILGSNSKLIRKSFKKSNSIFLTPFGKDESRHWNNINNDTGAKMQRVKISRKTVSANPYHPLWFESD